MTLAGCLALEEATFFFTLVDALEEALLETITLAEVVTLDADEEIDADVDLTTVLDCKLALTEEALEADEATALTDALKTVAATSLASTCAEFDS
ncbi:hypothetical protein WEIDD23_00662 [Weissella sp. DD23]|nr:hypothetical protein WEIDD23_00662 [Weissella sp. DD23]